jgi:hypothetical protein
MIADIVLWVGYFLIMTGLCYLCAALRIIQKSDLTFFLVYTWVMGGICVMVGYFNIRWPA